MNEYLIKLGVVQQSSIEFDVTMEEFNNLLRPKLDLKNSNMKFSRGENDYNGYIAGDKFYVNQNFVAFDNSYTNADITGTIETNDTGIKIAISVNAFKAREIIFASIGLILLFVGIIGTIVNMNSSMLAIISFGLGALLFSWFPTKTSAINAIKKFERDLFYYVKNKSL
tara:strand:+ start:101 stop:607 length:507 start_codon:yes stop_codon:yes gene_type:complete